MKFGNQLASITMCAMTLGLTSGCVLTESPDSIDGQLTVSKAFTLVDKNGKTQSLSAKSYDATLDMSSKGADLSISTNLISSIDLLLPNPVSGSDGPFTVSAADSKQSFNITGDIEANTTTQQVTGTNSCVVGYEHKTVCTVAPDPKTHQPVKTCVDTTVEIDGFQDYTATEVDYDRTVNMTLVDSASGETIATFTGSYDSSDVENQVNTDNCHLQ